MTHYIYKGEEITHIDFISLCQKNGICAGRGWSHYDKLVDMAEKGNEKAIALLMNLELHKTPNPEKPIGLHSPKNRYLVLIGFEKPLKYLGSEVSFGTMNIEGVEDFIRKYFMYNQPQVGVTILENMKKYPEFSWKAIRQYNLAK